MQIETLFAEAKAVAHEFFNGDVNAAVQFLQLREMRTNATRRLVGFYTTAVPLTPEIIRLENQKCDVIYLSVANTEFNPSDSFKPKDADGTYDESDEEIYWGFANNCVHQIFPRDGGSRPYLIPVNNAQDIYAKSSVKRPDPTKLCYSLFRYIGPDDLEDM